MPRILRISSRKAGLAPGTLIHIGEPTTRPVKITLMDYDADTFQEKVIETVEECTPFRAKPTVTWIHVDGVHQVEIVSKLGECFGLHSLLLEDILHTDQRAKLENYDDHLFIVLKMLRYDEEAGSITEEQVSIILGESFVLSFQEKEGTVLNPLRGRIRDRKGRVRRAGADYLVYGILDAIVDSYFVVLEKIGEKIEQFEDEIVANPTRETLSLLQRLRREMIHFRRSVWPLREMIGSLHRGDSPWMQESTTPYLRDVYDHTVRQIETADTYRDILGSLLEIYLSSISNRMNEVMKVLTMFATIFIPLTFIVGVYGMNFRCMPELEWKAGYPILWAVMVAIAATLLIYFRRKKWL